MTNVEISIIVIAIFIPIVALVIFLPRLKKDKKNNNSPKPSAHKIEERPIEITESPKEEANPRELFKSTEFNSDDFRGYLTEKSNSIEKPTRKDLDFDGGMFDDGLFDDLSFGGPRRKQTIKKEDKPIIEQFCDLSPELKALIVTGALDKKDY